MREWLAFCLAGLFWGSSFLWIKLALEEVGPLTLVAFRLLFALVGLTVVLLVRKHKLPRDGLTLRRIAFLAILSPFVPFLLISWGETRIDSGLAAILNGSIPLFTTLAAHFFLRDDRLSLSKVVGLVAGFSGVVVLFGRDLGAVGGTESRSVLLGELAVVAAVVLYAASTIYARLKLREESPITLSVGVMFFADGFAWLFVLGARPPFVLPHHALTWVALIWMGLLGSCAAFLCFFHLLNVWGASRTSLINYLTPMVGIVLGIVFRNEQLDWHLIGGSGLILSGILVVNFKALGLERLVRPWKNRHLWPKSKSS